MLSSAASPPSSVAATAAAVTPTASPRPRRARAIFNCEEKKSFGGEGSLHHHQHREKRSNSSNTNNTNKHDEDYENRPSQPSAPRRRSLRRSQLHHRRCGLLHRCSAQQVPHLSRGGRRMNNRDSAVAAVAATAGVVTSSSSLTDAADAANSKLGPPASQYGRESD